MAAAEAAKTIATKIVTTKISVAAPATMIPTNMEAAAAKMTTKMVATATAKMTTAAAKIEEGTKMAITAVQQYR